MPFGAMFRNRAVWTAFSLLFLCLAQWGLRRNALSLPLMSDEGEYACEARLLRQGGLPYRDAYDQKPPMVFWLYRAAFQIFGENDPSAARKLALLFGWAATLALFFLVPEDWGTCARFCAAAAFAAASNAPVGDLGFAANTEVFLCAWTSLAAWALLRRPRPFAPWAPAALCGLFCGLALTTKQTSIWTALAFAGLLAATRQTFARRARTLLAYGLGFSAAPLFFAATFALRGGLKDLWEQAWRRNMGYAALLASPELLRMQWNWFSHVLAPQLLRGLWPMLVLALFGLCARGRKDLAEDRVDADLLAALWLAASLLGVCAGFFLFPHYFLQAFPPLALCAALGVRRLSLLRGQRTAWTATAFAALYPAAAWGSLFFRTPPETLARALLFPNPLYEAQTVARFVRERTRPEDEIYIFGSEPQIYFYAQRRWATRHIFVYPLTLFPKGPQDVEIELERLSAKSPRILIYSTFPASTLIASESGLRLQEGVRALARQRYRCLGFVQALPQGAREELEGPCPRVPWSVPDALLVFERTGVRDQRLTHRPKAVGRVRAFRSMTSCSVQRSSASSITTSFFPTGKKPCFSAASIRDRSFVRRARTMSPGSRSSSSSRARSSGAWSCM
jgi:4-amino-4-deoxy-L-arabinose transferase-like glycosyltransferase